MTRTVNLSTREAIAQAMRLMLDHYELGNVLTFSIEASTVGTARLSIIYDDGFEPPELLAETGEDDENET